MLSKYKYLFTWTLFYLIFSLSMPVYAAAWYEEDKLYKATLQEWKKASKEDKLVTCTAIILATIKDDHFKIPIDDVIQLKTYSSRLLSVIDDQANNNDTVTNNEKIVITAIYSMISLGWVDKSYPYYLYQRGIKKLNITDKKVSSVPKYNNDTNTPKTPNVSTKTKVQSKRKLMSKKTGHNWVKHNLPLRSQFNLDDLVQRFGEYEKKTTGNVELYYFKRIDMTFFVLSASHEFVGFTLCKPSR